VDPEMSRVEVDLETLPLCLFEIECPSASHVLGQVRTNRNCRRCRASWVPSGGSRRRAIG